MSVNAWWPRHYGISNRRRDKPKNPYCKLCGKAMGANLPNRSNCGSCRTTIRRPVLKMIAVKLLGGKCQRCGWSEHITEFEFHHRDGRQEKRFQIGGQADRAWAAVRAELQKCDLLCSTAIVLNTAGKTIPPFALRHQDIPECSLTCCSDFSWWV